MMKTVLKVASVVAFVLALGLSGADAGPMPVLVSPLQSQVELVKEHKAKPAKALSKAWFKQKKKRAVTWARRQKEKVKALVRRD